MKKNRPTDQTPRSSCDINTRTTMKRILFACTLAVSQLITAQNVTTIAGNASSGAYNANGILATFNGPHDIAINAAGEIFVVDHLNHLIRKIAVNGDLTNFAGSTAGFADGTGAAAQFNYPAGICFGSNGDLYVTDYSNHCIRKITPAGVVSTVAGSGTAGGTNANGTNASFNGPVGITINAFDEIYVTEQIGHRIRKIQPNGDVFTVAGSGNPGYSDGLGVGAVFNAPYGITIDDSNYLYVVDQLNHRIRKISPLAEVTTFAGSGTQTVMSGTGTNAGFFTPWGITFDSNSSNLFVVGGGHVIQQITPNAEVTTYAGFANGSSFMDGTLLDARFNGPTGIAMGSDGKLIVADYYNNRIRSVEYSVSLEENDTPMISVFPNPTSDQLTILSNTPFKEIRIFNSLGQLVQTETSTSFSIAGLTKGIYFISISTDQGIVQHKIIKE